jgi:hypothetical protein
MKKTQSIIKRTPTVAKALAIAGLKLKDLISKTDTKDEAAYKVLKAVIKVLNQEWKADHADSSQVKYEPIFYFDKAKGGFVYDGYDGWIRDTSVGSRLCFRSAEVLKHGVKILKKYYQDYLN